ncbi:MAG TPA: sulfatase-like hydrolase/transferase [Opitutaceae bacterium]|nr:sulfatase-like hydrolase/transferase [Opitutaceae bacterium]
MPRAKPNILWVLTTQWRGQATGFAGDPNARTPCLDRLAASGVSIRNAVTPHPFGPFARAAILTGVPSPENGVVDYWDPLPAGSRTIAHEMSALGYSTAWFGKWHLAERDRSAPLVGEVHARQIVSESRRGGFEFWEGFESGFLLNDPWLHGTRLPEPVQFRGYQADVISGRAAEWLSAKRSATPWFAVVSLESPHPPYDAPSVKVPHRNPASIVLDTNVPRGGEVEARARRELAGYYAHIEATDAAIGRLCDALPENNIVVITSVHGDMHGAHGLFRKGWPHEESVRVPLIVRGGWFRNLAPGTVASLIDLSAMTRAWAVGEDWEFSEAARISMPAVVALPHQCDRVWRGVRTAEWMLALNADGTPWLLFDLRADPTQMANLVDEPEYAMVIERLQALV